MNKPRLQGLVVGVALIAIGAWNIYYGIAFQRTVGLFVLMGGLVVLGTTGLKL